MSSFHQHLTQFFCYLKQQGIAVSTAEEIEACQAATHIDILNRQVFYYAMRACVAKTYVDQQIFHRAFHEYWHSGVVKQQLSTANASSEQGNDQQGKENVPVYHKAKNSGSNVQAMFSYSPLNNIRQQYFVPVIDQNLQRTVEQIAQQLASSLDRKYRRCKQKRFHLRNTIYKNRKYHPDILRLHFCAKKRRKLKLIVLCDTSYSMKNYNYFFLQFIFAFCKYYKQVKSFLFNTQLYDITEQAQYQSIHNVLSISQSGTRIGESLWSFCLRYRHLLDKSTYIIIVSDGWDRGDINSMERAMQQLQYRSKGVIWLNPWSATVGFEPSTRCMTIAKPYIEILSSVHDIKSLKKFSHLLCR